VPSNGSLGCYCARPRIKAWGCSLALHHPLCEAAASRQDASRLAAALGVAPDRVLSYQPYCLAPESGVAVSGGAAT